MYGYLLPVLKVLWLNSEDSADLTQLIFSTIRILKVKNHFCGSGFEKNAFLIMIELLVNYVTPSQRPELLLNVNNWEHNVSLILQ